MQEVFPAHPPEGAAGQLLSLAAQVPPEIQEGQEVAVVVGEAGVLGAGRLLPVRGAFPWVGDRQRCGDDEHFRQAALGIGLQDHPAQAGVDGKLGEPAAEIGDARRLVERTEFLQHRDAVVDAAPLGRVDERELGDVAELQRRHLQDHRGEVGPQDLRVGVERPAVEVLLGVQPDADPGRGASGPPRPLRRRRLGDRFDRQPLDFRTSAVAGDPGGSGIDHVANARNRQRRFGDVGGQHHAAGEPTDVGDEHLVLFGGGQPGIQRQHFDTGLEGAPDRLGGVADLPLPGQEHQDVARRFGRKFAQRVDDRLGLIAGFDAHDFVVGIVGIVIVVDPTGKFQRPITDLDRIRTPGNLHDRGRPTRTREVRGEAFRIDGGRGDDDFEIGASRQQFAQIAEQEVDVEAAFVGLVEDQGVVAQQPTVALDLGEQDAVGHEFDQGSVADVVGEPHAVSDGLSQWRVQFLGDALRDGPGGQPPGLGVADHAAHPAAEFQADLRQLGGLAGSGLTGHHHHLMRCDLRGQLASQCADRQVGVADLGHRRRPRRDQSLGRRDLPGEVVESCFADRAGQRAHPTAQTRGIADGQAVQARTQLAYVSGGRLGHWDEDSWRRTAKGVGP